MNFIFFARCRGLEGPANDENIVENEESIDQDCLFMLTSVFGYLMFDVGYNRAKTLRQHNFCSERGSARIPQNLNTHTSFLLKLIVGVVRLLRNSKILKWFRDMTPQSLALIQVHGEFYVSHGMCDHRQPYWSDKRTSFYCIE